MSTHPPEHHDSRHPTFKQYATIAIILFVITATVLEIHTLRIAVALGIWSKKFATIVFAAEAVRIGLAVIAILSGKALAIA